MNVLKLSALASLVGISGYANAIVSGSADVAVTGSLNGSNQCTVVIDGGAVLDAGIHHIADLGASNNRISEYKEFSTTVNCIFPTAIAVKYSSSLPNSTGTYKLGAYLTSTNKEAAHIYAELSAVPPTAGGVNQTYAGVGDQDLSVISSANTFSAVSPNTAISGIAGDVRNAYTVTDSSNNPIAATTFVLPFKMGVWHNSKSSGWPDDIAEGVLSLSSTVTIELHTI